MKGSIEDWEDSGRIRGDVQISLVGSSGLLEFRTTMDSSGNFTVSADPGNYTVTVAPASGNYRPFRTRVYIPAKKEVRLDVELVKTGTGTLDVYLYDVNGRSVTGATVSITNDFSGVSQLYSYTSSGKYTFSGINSGYYTVSAYKSGFDSHSFKVTVPPGTGTTRNIFRTLYAAANAKYAIYLESEKTFLSPHMLIKYSNGSTQDVNASEPQTFAPNGRESGYYDSFYSGRIKFTYYTHFASTEYRYYVHWNSSDDVDWNGTKPRVYLYYKGSLLKVYTPPKNATSDAYWDVFRITRNGTRYTTEEISETAPTID